MALKVGSTTSLALLLFLTTATMVLQHGEGTLTSSPNAGDVDRGVPTADSSDTPSSSGDDGGDKEPDLATATPAPAAYSGSSSVQCVAELRACGDDEVCADCWMASFASSFGECMEAYFGDDLCTALSGPPCCTDEISTQDCMGNDQFVGYYLCINSVSVSALGEEECTTLTCGGLSGGGGGGRDDFGATVPTPTPAASVAANTLSPQDTGGVGGGSNDSNPTALTPAPSTSVAADTSSPPDTGTTSPAPSVAPLLTGSTSARDLDFTPSPTTEGGEESEAAPATTTGSSAPCASGPNTRMLILIGTLTVLAHILWK